MFNIGFSEAVIIFTVALIVLGPEKLPELGKYLAKLSIELKKSVEEIKKELEIDEVEKNIQEAKEELKELITPELDSEELDFNEKNRRS